MSDIDSTAADYEFEIEYTVAEYEFDYYDEGHIRANRKIIFTGKSDDIRKLQNSFSTEGLDFLAKFTNEYLLSIKSISPIISSCTSEKK